MSWAGARLADFIKLCPQASRGASQAARKAERPVRLHGDDYARQRLLCRMDLAAALQPQTLLAYEMKRARPLRLVMARP